MTKSKKVQAIKYMVGDFITANVAWVLLNFYRYDLVGSRHFGDLYSYLFSVKVLLGQLVVPLVWMLVYYYSGYYNSPIRRSRLSELKTTLVSVEVGTLGIFFIMMVDDLPNDYHIYYHLIAALFLLYFVLTYSARALITSRITQQVHNREIGSKTLILGSGIRARKLAEELDAMPQSLGYLIEGFIDTGKELPVVASERLLGKWEDVRYLVESRGIEELIVASDSDDEKDLFELLNGLYQYNLPLKAIASSYGVLARSVRMSTIYASPMIEITRDNMSDGQKNIKDTLDRLVALVVLLLLSPLYAYLAWRVKRDSPGTIFYKQERLGYRAKPFFMIKFRTMQQNAEGETPQLSSETDRRITSFGRVMRKYRLDELPQFWHVLKGEMSMVGPRPERKFFVDQIVQKAPAYYLMYTVKPGITSWGMVKYGYANTVDKMIERLNFDIIYLENRSIMIDLKILIYTIRTILTGQGV